MRKKLNSVRKNLKYKLRIIVLADGETEESYIKRLNTLKYFNNLAIKFEKGDENNFEVKFAENMENTLLLILDIDNCNNNKDQLHRKEKIKKLIDSKTYKGCIFYNNYSFETWLLLHKFKFNTQITFRHNYDQFMTKYFGVENWSKYKNDKNRKLIMKQIDIKNIEVAISNCKNLYNNLNTNNGCFKNPSSNMHLLMELLKQLNYKYK